jgi:4'-phosphopantetheinyl transferase
VDIRLVDLNAGGPAVARAESCLTAGELARARRGTPPVHRRRVLLRAALRSALAAELGTDPARVPLVTTPTGRPSVASPAGSAFIDISGSASGGLGIVAVGRACRVGVDLELVLPWSSDVLDEGWLGRGERLALVGLPPAERPVAVARCWTQKEAVLKGRGTGLHQDPAGVVTVIGQRSGVVAGWQVQDVTVPAGWIATLAVAPEEAQP